MGNYTKKDAITTVASERSERREGNREIETIVYSSKECVKGGGHNKLGYKRRGETHAATALREEERMAGWGNRYNENQASAAQTRTNKCTRRRTQEAVGVSLFNCYGNGSVKQVLQGVQPIKEPCPMCHRLVMPAAHWQQSTSSYRSDV